MSSLPPAEPGPCHRSGFWILLVLLAGIFSALFLPNFRPEMAHFANDGPIGTLLARPYAVPESYRGIWNDLLWLGAKNGNFNPNLTGLAIGLLGPERYHKFMIPIGLIFLGLSASICFHRLGFPRWVGVLGGLAAALNMNPFSNACWGLPSRAHAMGAAFLAVAALHGSLGRYGALKAVVAGLALGFGISEGGDNGAIFAIVAGSYGFYRALAGAGTWPARAGRGAGRVILAALFAVLFAAQMLNLFVSTAVQGVVGMAEDGATPEQKWDFATQGSLHPKETLRVVIPGLYGYRMDAEHGGTYWGRVGESLASPGTSRHSGAGEHAGVVVVLLALWALVHSVRGPAGAFTELERRCVWFWGGAAAVCLLLAWGKWGPFYRLLYALPYFNAVRLPLKWMQPFHLSVLILFGFGATGLGRLHLGSAGASRAAGRGRRTLQAWWRGASPEERRWVWISAAIAGLALAGALLYAGAQPSLVQRLSQANVAGEPAEIAAFSLREVLLFLIFLAGALAWVLAVMSGRFAGRRVALAFVALGLLVVTDLVRANLHWMLFFNYRERYAMNGPLQHLKDFAAQYRVAKVPQAPVAHALQAAAEASRGDRPILEQLQQQLDLFRQILGYTHEQWQQNHFQYYNIPCLDMSQEPRLPVDKLAFNTALAAAASNGHPAREYELTSVRHLVGVIGQAELCNASLDPAARRFRECHRFSLVPGRPDGRVAAFGDLRAQSDTNGPFALIEFTGALPRAALFTNWEVIPGEAQTLARLGSADFDPATTVLVHDRIPGPEATPGGGRGDAILAAIRSSHRLVVEVNATAPGVLLVTDRYDPDWRVTVDGRPAPLLRCNYLMRGVQVSAGAHRVEFAYHPSMSGFWLMAGCEALGVGLLAFLRWTGRGEERR